MFCLLSLGWMSDVKKGGNHVKIGKEMKLKVSSLISLVMWTKTMATSRMKTKNSYNSKNIGNTVK